MVNVNIAQRKQVGEERWLRFFVACLQRPSIDGSQNDIGVRALQADEALREYFKRFPQTDSRADESGL